MTEGQEGNEASFLMWFVFNAVIFAALWFDLKSNRVIGKSPLKRAAYVSAFWVALALAFALILCIAFDRNTGATFLVGYLVEKSLSVDNLIVILLIFKHFRIKPGRQPRVLKLGILGAVFMRAVFIFAGIRMLEMFEWTVYIFGGVLVYAAIKTYQEDGSEEEEDERASANGTNSVIVRALSACIPYTTNNTTTDFFVRTHRSKRLVATPMFAALLVVEFSDVMFAIDSIPCILGLTTNRFIVYSSNMLAILGLRSLYILLADALHRVRYLQTGLAFILGFVGIKMLLGEMFHISQTWSLMVILGILVATVLYEKFADTDDDNDGKRRVMKRKTSSMDGDVLVSELRPLRDTPTLDRRSHTRRYREDSV